MPSVTCLCGSDTVGRSPPDPPPPFSDATLLLSPRLLSLLCPLTERRGLRDPPGPPWASTPHTSQPHLGSLSPSCLGYHCQRGDCSPASPRLPAPAPAPAHRSASPLRSLAERLHLSPPTWVPSRPPSSLGPQFKRSKRHERFALLLLAPRLPLSYCWLTSGPHSQ